MANVPDQGANTGTWGTDLNAHLATEHNTDGTHAAVTADSVTSDAFNIVCVNNAVVCVNNNVVTV